jgi:hypothetical protein
MLSYSTREMRRTGDQSTVVVPLVQGALKIPIPALGGATGPLEEPLLLAPPLPLLLPLPPPSSAGWSPVEPALAHP